MSTHVAPAARAPVVDADGVTFVLADPFASFSRVLLKQELGLAEPLDFEPVRDRWTFRLERPSDDETPLVDRMEYLVEVHDRNGHTSTTTDPANPLHTGGAFGDKSVIEFPGYHRPTWLRQEPVRAGLREVQTDAPELDSVIDAVVWEPDVLDAGTAAPLVVVHDGPEFDALGRFTRYLGVQIATGAIAPVRALLLGPGLRNSWYSANPGYADALVGRVLAETSRLPPATARIGVGVSLGGLSMLHAHISHPGVFDALLLQSGSFFTPRLDPQESGFPGFEAVTGFVSSVPGSSATPVPVSITCGLLEENLANNQAMAATLRALGYPVTFTGVRDTHNYTAWRDSLHPQLAILINTVAHNHVGGA